MNLSRFSIRDLEQISGIKAHTLRMWEKRYGLFSPQRSTSNVRSFSDRDLQKVLNISILNRNGFKISRIAGLDEWEIRERVVSLNMDSLQSASQIEALIVAMMELDEDHFKRIISGSILSSGMEATFLEIIFPFMRRVGILWQTGSVNPAQEHFMTNLIRQKIIAGIAGLPPVYGRGKRSILFLPEGELHELGLLFYSYLLRKWENEVLYLGAMTPLESVAASEADWPAEVIITSVTSTINQDTGIEDYIRKLATSFKGKTVVVAGPVVNTIRSCPYDNVIFINCVHDLQEFYNS